jgi:hypothetical protein
MSGRKCVILAINLPNGQRDRDDTGSRQGLQLKLARVPACSPLPVTALPSMSLIPSAPFTERERSNNSEE